MTKFSYEYYREALKDVALPQAFIDLDRFDENVYALQARSGDKHIRVASKSVRCQALLKRVFAAHDQYQGILAFSSQEAAWLATQGFDDIIVAYPVYRQADIEAICPALHEGKTVVLMVDSPEHVEAIAAVAQREQVFIPVCIDVDMSSDFASLHFGVWRSRVKGMDEVEGIVQAIDQQSSVTLDSVMGYEAQIAGVPDKVPGQGIKNAVVRHLKKKSIAELRKRRAAVVEGLIARGVELRVVNGGGTGSLESTREEAVITEVTVGSGFYTPALFDGYQAFSHAPAAGFALEITRIPKDKTYTCLGGGYIASGGAGKDRLPTPFLPDGATLFDLEGAGEVQTPIHYTGPVELGLGDPVLFRHAKAGELCERFTSLLLIQDGTIVDEVPTYRGEKQCFF